MGRRVDLKDTFDGIVKRASLARTVPAEGEADRDELISLIQQGAITLVLLMDDLEERFNRIEARVDGLLARLDIRTSGLRG